jgi:16S rRNA (uracil1498-N3)-methyltransferase
MKVALVTTHVPLSQVSHFITSEKLDQTLKNLGNEKVIACVERSSHAYDMHALKEIFKTHPNILIGPEGGFSEAEKRILENHPNIIPLSLGENILRAETAALSMLSIIQFFKTL